MPRHKAGCETDVASEIGQRTLADPAVAQSGINQAASASSEELCLCVVALRDHAMTLDTYPVLESWLSKKHPNFGVGGVGRVARYPEAKRFKEILREGNAVDRPSHKFNSASVEARCETPVWETENQVRPLPKSQCIDPPLPPVVPISVIGMGHALAELRDQLIRLETKYAEAEEEDSRAASLCYSSEFQAALAKPGLSVEERSVLTHAREKETGFHAGFEKRIAAIYTEIVDCSKKIIALDSIEPTVLAIKARACLVEKRLSFLHDDEWPCALELINRLAALG